VSAVQFPAPAVRARDIVLAVCLVVGGLAAAVLPNRIAIDSPSLGGPRILTPGENVEIVVRAGVPWLASVDAATLVHDGSRVPLTLSGVESDGPVQRVTARVPLDCAPGVWDLEVQAGATTAATRRSVAVLATIPKRFTIAQITDLHIGYATWSEMLVERIVAEINRIGPAVVVVSGDIANQGRWEEYRRATEILGRLDAPIVTVPGNHDRRGRAGYLSTFGPGLATVRFGRWAIVRLDAGHGRDEFTLTQIRALERTLATTEPGCVIAVSHIPLAGRRSVKSRTAEVAELLERYRVPLVLSGHLHYETAYAMAGAPGAADTTRYVVTATAGGNLIAGPGEETPAHGFRVITVDDDHIASVTEHRIAPDGTDEADGAGARP
jgi:3',5'-cyclic-AMP phosphodiesterase